MHAVALGLRIKIRRRSVHSQYSHIDIQIVNYDSEAEELIKNL